MKLHANVFSVITLLICLISLPTHADSILATLNYWTPGATTSNQATYASFKGGATADGGKSFATTFDAEQKIDVLTYIRVAIDHVGKTGSLYMVARYNNAWFVKVSDSQWQPWNNRITDLVSYAGPRLLEAMENIKVAEQLSGLVGNFDVYVGYKIDGDIHYNAKPFSFTVKEKLAPVVSTNIIPIADAGIDKDINELTQVTLDGSLSRDPDGSIVKYLWEQTNGTTAKLDNPASAKLTFTAPEVARAMDLNFKLTVTDNQGATASDTVTVIVRDVSIVYDYVPNPTCSLQQILQEGICVTPTPTCTPPQVLQGNQCVTPPPTCTPPQVLQGNQCVTPTPTCTPPQVLQGNQCVTPTPTCTPPQVLQGNQCVTPPTCTPPQVLQGNQCVTPTPTCTPPQVLQNNVCVTPVASNNLADSTAFLYTGSNPIQTGVAQGTIETKRAAVIRGKITDKQNNPLSGVALSILNHPEFGQTQSRADGLFDLAVNGGGQLTVRYVKDGFLAIQRAIITPWRDYVWLPDVVMIPFDTAVTTVDLNAATLQVARGNPVTDTDGTRQATVLIPAGTTASMVLPDGTTQPLTTINLRATEYTVGASGPKAMPAPLPPSSGYTYAAEFSVDEAVAADATGVFFNQALPVYVENFLGFPVGGAVPSGYYDRQKGQWVASANGRVIKVLSITNNQADLDIDGAGSAANAAALAALGITDQELTRLAQLYAPGQSLWRVPITHFTPCDFNWPYGPPPNAPLPPPPGDPQPHIDKPQIDCGSVIGCEEQILGELVPVAGTPWRLHYQSERTPGRKDASTLTIPVSDSTPLPASLLTIRVEVSIAGRLYKKTYDPAPNLKYTVAWDGLDAYGRSLQGAQTASINVYYDYVPQYYGVDSDLFNAFGRVQVAFGMALVVNRVETVITLSRSWSEPVGLWQASALGLGGWSLSVQHAYGQDFTLLLGDGRQRRAEALSSIITTVAGMSSNEFIGDGGPATAAGLVNPRSIAVGPDGSLYITADGTLCIRRVGPDGIITTVAGNGVLGFSGDGGPATAAKLGDVIDIAVGPDGSLYIPDTYNNRVRRVGPDGIITTVAGNGVPGFSGDGGSATAAQLDYIRGVAVGMDGSLFITGNSRIRRVGPDGIITTIAGDGVGAFSGDGGLATSARVQPNSKVAVGPDGSLYFADYYHNRIRRIGPDGIITTVAGNGVNGFVGDGGSAITARLANPQAVAVGLDGSLFIADYGNNRIRRVGTNGIITTIAGTGGFGGNRESGPGGDGGEPRFYLWYCSGTGR